MRILGLPFRPGVKNQIDVRQTKLAQLDYQPETLTVFNSATSFVRLSSAISVSGSSERSKSLETNLGLSQEDISGYNLAKKLVLWGGVNIQNLPGGVGYSLDNTYGFLSDEKQGLKPLPGITGMTTTYKNNGSLKEATIQIKCFTRKQFEAIEAVYLRLGYTMVLEWGHTDYFKNNGSKGSTTAYSIIDKLFSNQSITDFDILQQIEANKKNTSYNYDGLLARVTNFNWTLNSDLSYDITLYLISWGDIIDSLKINTNNNSSGVTSVGIGQSNEDELKIPENTLSILNNKSLSTLNSFFYEIHQLLTGEIGLNLSEENKEVLEEIERQNKLLPQISIYKTQSTLFLNGLINEIKKYPQPQSRRIFNLRGPLTLITEEEDKESINRLTSSVKDLLNKINSITTVTEWEKEFKSTVYLNELLLYDELKNKIYKIYTEIYKRPTTFSTSFEEYIKTFEKPYTLNFSF